MNHPSPAPTGPAAAGSPGVLRFLLNGEPVEPTGWTPTTTLLSWLRASGRTGSKEGCAEGDCGACTVAMVEPGPEGPAWRAVNACILLLPSLQGRSLVTVEGLAAPGGRPGAAPHLHPAQQAMVERLGSQCGYCTPGFVMSLFEATYRAELAAGPAWLREDQLAGNLCRCTGYRPIREALDDVAGACPDDRFTALLHRPALPAALSVQIGDQRFEQPATLAEALRLLAEAPEARLVAGATDLGLEVTLRGKTWPTLISLDAIPELREIRNTPDVFHIGAGARLSALEAATAVSQPLLHRMLRYFGARGIKNRGTVGGNLCTASPIGDLAPVMLALDATFVLASAAGERRLSAQDFFVAYRTTALRPGELLLRVELPAAAPGAQQAAFKVSRRRELDISTVSAAFSVQVDAAGRVRSARLAFGGMGALPLRATQAEAALLGALFDEEAMRRAAAALPADLSPRDDLRASASYRMRVAKNLLLGFFLERRRAGLRAGAAALPPRHTATVALDLSAGGAE